MPRNKSDRKKFLPNDPEIASAATVVETASAVLADGTMLEMVLNSECRNEPLLLAWNGKEATVSQRFEHNAKVYVPPKLNAPLTQALRLPTKITPYGSTRDLFNEILKLLIRYSRLAEICARQIVYSFFASWLIEHLAVAPLLSIIAPVGSARAQFLALLSTFYRRPLMLAEANLGFLSCLPTDLRPTCLFDEPELSRRAQRLLYASHNRGAVIARNRRIIDAFSAKVVCTRERLRDSLLASQALEISLSPACLQSSFLDMADIAQMAEEFQSKLLLYRLMNYGKVHRTEIDVVDLSAPMQDVARSLALSVVDDEELQREVVDVLRERDREIRILRSTEPQSTILEALIFCIHEDWSKVLCGELADIVNELWTKRGEGQQITPESVGWKLGDLNLHTEPIGSEGRGLRFTNAVRGRVHALARQYRVPTLQQTTKKGCPYCDASTAVSAAQAAPPAPRSKSVRLTDGSDGFDSL